MPKVSFAARHPWDSRFWAIFLATSWFAVAMGFWLPVKLRFTGMADYAAPPILIVHVWAYFGWLTLLPLQALLAARKRIDLHKRLGLAGMVLAVFVTLSGVTAEVYSQRFYAPIDPENVRFFMVPLVSAIGFGTMAFLAFAKRRDPSAHKRLIYLATCTVVQGPYGRWWGSHIEAAIGPGYLGTFGHWFTGLDLLLLIGAAYDLMTRGTVHRVYRYGIPFLLALQIAGVLVWYSNWWPPLGRELLGLSGPR